LFPCPNCPAAMFRPYSFVGILMFHFRYVNIHCSTIVVSKIHATTYSEVACICSTHQQEVEREHEWTIQEAGRRSGCFTRSGRNRRQHTQQREGAREAARGKQEARCELAQERVNRNGALTLPTFLFSSLQNKHFDTSQILQVHAAVSPVTRFVQVSLTCARCTHCQYST